MLLKLQALSLHATADPPQALLEYMVDYCKTAGKEPKVMVQGWHGSPLRYQFSTRTSTHPSHPPTHEPRAGAHKTFPDTAGRSYAIATAPQTRATRRPEPPANQSHTPPGTWGVKDQADQFLPQLTHITPAYCAQRGLPVRRLAAPSPDHQAALWDFQIQTDKIVMAYHHGGRQTPEKGCNDRCSNPKRYQHQEEGT